jgi:quinol monooxygenase YgiN
VNERHLEALASDEWRHTLETLAFPFAFGSGGPTILGDDPLEFMRWDADVVAADEPGTLRFDVYPANDEPDTIYLYEAFVDDAGFEAHNARRGALQALRRTHHPQRHRALRADALQLSGPGLQSALSRFVRRARSACAGRRTGSLSSERSSTRTPKAGSPCPRAAGAVTAPELPDRPAALADWFVGSAASDVTS